jgi:hypothetical protein
VASSKQVRIERFNFYLLMVVSDMKKKLASAVYDRIECAESFAATLPRRSSERRERGLNRSDRSTTRGFGAGSGKATATADCMINLVLCLTKVPLGDSSLHSVTTP